MDGIEYIAQHNYGNQVWWYLIQRSFLIETGVRFIEGRWMEDALFTATLFLQTNRIAFLDLAVHRYVEVENSAMTSKDSTHNINLIYDLANAAEKFEVLISSLDGSHLCYDKCFKRLKSKQQSFVFAIIIKAINFQLNFTDLKKILLKMNKIGA